MRKRLSFTKTQYINMYLELGGVTRDEIDSHGSVWSHQWNLVYCALNGHEIRCGMKDSIKKILEERGLAKAKYSSWFGVVRQLPL
jgi:hypothetical protein